MELSKQQKRKLKRWNLSISEVKAMSDDECLFLFSEIDRLNEAMRTDVNYFCKVDKREQRHAVGFNSEENCFDKNGDEILRTKRVIGISNGRSKFINLYRSDRKSEDPDNKPVVISNRYTSEDKPGAGTYKCTPEDIYVNKCRSKFARETLRIVWPMLTQVQRETLRLKLVYIDAHCGKDCKYSQGDRLKNTECKYFGMSRVCIGDRKHGKRGSFQLGRYLQDYEIDNLRKRAKKTTSKLLERLPSQIAHKYNLHPDDRSFIFGYVD